jgi:hypothetical protein
LVVDYQLTASQVEKLAKLVKSLGNNVREDREQGEMDQELLVGEIRTMRQTAVKNEIRIEALEAANKGMLNLMSKMMDKVAALNRDVIQVGPAVG